MSEKADKLMELLGNTPIVVGLEAQGHIPTIERMLADGESWKAIGKAIGWCPKTAEQHYTWHLERAPLSASPTPPTCHYCKGAGKLQHTEVLLPGTLAEQHKTDVRPCEFCGGQGASPTPPERSRKGQMTIYRKKDSLINAVYFAGDVGDPEIMWLGLPFRRVVNGHDRDVLILWKDGKEVWVEPGQLVCWKDDAPREFWSMTQADFDAAYERVQP